MALESNPETASGPAQDPVPGPAAPPARPARPAKPRDSGYFVVIVMLIVDIVFGLALAVFAERVIAYRPMAVMGLGFAALGLGILAYYLLFGSGRNGGR
jgi:hypothetical protein